MKLAIRSLFLLSVLLPVSVAAQVTEDQKLTGSGGGIETEFGRAVALVETETEALALVGAPGDAEVATDAGAVYAYRYDETAGRWVEEAKFWPEEVGENAIIGRALALSDDGQLAFISGAEPGPESAPRYGRVYVFRRTDGAWVEEATLAASDETPVNGFGCSVAASDDGAVVAVGACQADGPRPRTGAVYIYRRDEAAGTWEEEAKVSTARGCFFTAFGAAVDISAAGDRAVTTEPCGEGSDPSALYFLHRSGTPNDPNGGWVREARFDETGGGAVALSEAGDLALAGLLFNSLVEIFEREEGVWEEVGQISSSGGSSNFGRDAIALEDNFVLIGDESADVFDENEGAAFLFRRTSGGEWSEEAQFVASDGVLNDDFGRAVALSERFSLAGAPFAGDADALTGAVYAFDLSNVVSAESGGLVGVGGIRLNTPYPNPSWGVASVELTMEEAADASVAVFDVLGRRVAVLHDGPLGAGAHRLRLDAAVLPAGVYVVRATAGNERTTRKLVVAR